MKAREIREMSDEELKKKLAESKDELFRLRFQHATGHLDNPMKLKEVKRRIARLRTVMRERELGIGHG
ncbi:MAG: 50S ribosomal protein L29 [Bacillota bacterium]